MSCSFLLDHIPDPHFAHFSVVFPTCSLCCLWLLILEKWPYVANTLASSSMLPSVFTIVRCSRLLPLWATVVAQMTVEGVWIDRTGSSAHFATCLQQPGSYLPTWRVEDTSLYGWLHGLAGGYELLLSHCCIRKPLVLIAYTRRTWKWILPVPLFISVEKLPRWLPPAVLSKRVPVASYPGRLFNISKCVWLQPLSNCCLCTGTWGVWAFECVPLIRVKLTVSSSSPVEGPLVFKARLSGGSSSWFRTLRM